MSEKKFPPPLGEVARRFFGFKDSERLRVFERFQRGSTGNRAGFGVGLCVGGAFVVRNPEYLREGRRPQEGPHFHDEVVDGTVLRRLAEAKRQLRR